MCKDSVRDLYERHARAYDRDRGRSLQERAWLDRFLAHVPPGGTVLDLGCGMGEPIARHLLSRGFAVVGVDSSPTLITLCRERFPESKWIVGDMRAVNLGHRFDGIIAWDSFFHLEREDQRAMFPTFAAHARPGAPLMFTSGTTDGESIGSYGDEPLYHSSLATAEYKHLLTRNGFTVKGYIGHDPDCAGHTVWLAIRDTHPTTPR